MNNCGNSDIIQEYVFKKQLPINEKYVYGSVVTSVIASTRMSWKYDDDDDTKHMDGASRRSLGPQTHHTYSLEDHTWSIQ